MAFLRRGTDESWSPCSTVDLRQLRGPRDGRVRFELLEDFGYTRQPPDGGSARRPTWSTAAVDHVVPAGLVTDLASVPALLWGVIASYGRHTLPAVLHDKLYLDLRAAQVSDGSPAGARAPRRVADQLFRTTLGEVGAGPVRRWLMWAATRVFGRSDVAVPFVVLAVVLVGIALLALLGALTAVAVAVAAVAVAAAGIVVAVLRAAVEGPPGGRRLRGAAAGSLVGAVCLALVAAAPMLVVILVTATVRFVVGLGEQPVVLTTQERPPGDIAPTARITWSPLTARAPRRRR